MNLQPKLTKTIKTQSEKQLQKDNLLRWLKEGDTILTLCNHVSSSGMTRRIKCYIIKDNRLLNISYAVSKVMEWPLNDKGLKISGCGMDMGFHVVYSLSSVLFKKESDKDAGYSLRHEWIS